MPQSQNVPHFVPGHILLSRDIVRASVHIPLNVGKVHFMVAFVAMPWSGNAIHSATVRDRTSYRLVQRTEMNRYVYDVCG